MSKSKPPKKKVVVTTQKKKVSPAESSRRRTVMSDSSNKEVLDFSRQNYLLMGAGALLIAIGLFLMAGGGMPSPEVWDDNIIYSTRRTLIAPMVILAGLVVEIVAIFKRA